MDSDQHLGCQSQSAAKRETAGLSQICKREIACRRCELNFNSIIAGANSKTHSMKYESLKKYKLMHTCMQLLNTFVHSIITILEIG